MPKYILQVTFDAKSRSYASKLIQEVIDVLADEGEDVNYHWTLASATNRNKGS